MSSPFNLSAHSSTQRTIEKECEDAISTGKINLSSRKIKEVPKLLSDYDLSDSTEIDISKNRFSDVPSEVCEFHSLESLNCYNNVIKSIPNAIQQLQALVHLDLSRNHLTTLPAALCKLRSLEVLLVCNNRLASLPEDIKLLESLMEFDLSCNQITFIPATIRDLGQLRYLNLRKNQLMELCTGICQLKLRKLDVSCNKIGMIPFEFQNLMDTIEEFLLGDNPLVCPPAQICTKGHIHVMKYLHSESLKEDRRRGIFGEMDLRKQHKPAWQQDQKHSFLGKIGGSDGIEFDANKRQSSSVCLDSGYNTNAETSDKMSVTTPESTSSVRYETFSPQTPPSVGNHGNTFPLQTPPGGNVWEVNRQNRRRSGEGYTGEPAMNTPPPASATIPHGQVLEHPSPPSPHLDTFTQELQRQKAEYDAKKRRAEKLRLEREYQQRGGSELGSGRTPTTPDQNTYQAPDNCLPESSVGQYVQRTSDTMVPQQYPLSSQLSFNAEAEFRQRHENLIAAQRREAQLVRERMENEKEKIRKMQKDAIFNFVRKTHDGRYREEMTYKESMYETNTQHEYPPESNYQQTTPNRLPYRCHQALQSMSTELNSLNPALTIRRNIQLASEEIDMISLLRQTIEDRLKITLPEDLSAALKDGVVLCHLANHIRPRSVSSIHVPSPAVPKLTAAKCRKNVENFFEACMKIGVSPNELCTLDDIVEELRPMRVANTVHRLVCLPQITTRDHDKLCPASAIQEEHGIVLVAQTVRYLLDCIEPPQHSTV